MYLLRPSRCPFPLELCACLSWSQPYVGVGCNGNSQDQLGDIDAPLLAVFGDMGWLSLALTFSCGALDAYSEAFAPQPKALPKSQAACTIESGTLKPNIEDLGKPPGGSDLEALPIKMGRAPNVQFPCLWEKGHFKSQ